MRKINPQHPLADGWIGYVEMVARHAEGDGVTMVEAQRRAFFGGAAVVLAVLMKMGQCDTFEEANQWLNAAGADLDAEQRRMYSAFVGDVRHSARANVEH